MKYKGEVVHIIGGIQEYIGEIEEGDHKNGIGWHRINNACLTFKRVYDNDKKIHTVVSALRGYRKFVDQYIPPDLPIEVLTLDKNDELYKVYKKEINQVKTSHIILPNSDVVSH